METENKYYKMLVERYGFIETCKIVSEFPRSQYSWELIFDEASRKFGHEDCMKWCVKEMITGFGEEYVFEQAVANPDLNMGRLFQKLLEESEVINTEDDYPNV